MSTLPAEAPRQCLRVMPSQSRRQRAEPVSAEVLQAAEIAVFGMDTDGLRLPRNCGGIVPGAIDLTVPVTAVPF